MRLLGRGRVAGLLLAAWLIVDTIMKVMFSDSVNFGPWNEIC